MQQHNKFSFALNGPTLNVHKVEHFEGLESGLYRRVFIAQNGLWYAELDAPPEQDYEEYFRKALDAASILIGATVYECLDLALVAISPRLGVNCAVISVGGIYAVVDSGHLFPLEMTGAMYHTPISHQPQGFARQMDYRGPMFMGDYQPVVPPQQYGYQVPPIMSEVIIPGMRSAGGKLVDHGGFLHWVPSGAHRPKPIPVVNPTIGFEARMDMEQTIRQALALLQRNGYYPLSPQSYQHRFDMSGDERNQQEIG